MIALQGFMFVAAGLSRKENKMLPSIVSFLYVRMYCLASLACTKYIILQLQSHQHWKPCRSFSFPWINLLTRTDLRGKRIRKIRRQQNICVAWCKCDYPKGGKERKEKHAELYKTYYVFFYLTRWDNKNIFILNKTYEKKP